MITKRQLAEKYNLSMSQLREQLRLLPFWNIIKNKKYILPKYEKLIYETIGEP